MARLVKVLCVGSGSDLKKRITALHERHLNAVGCSPEQLLELLASTRFDVVLLPPYIQRNDLAVIRENSSASAIVCLEDFAYPPGLVEMITLAELANLNSRGTS
ncbi:MAG: hypothetical protein WA510_14080 [Acidobacteriaceae bacterium]